MNIKHERTLKNGKRQVLVELDANEEIMSFKDDRFYRLGYPVEDVVGGHVLTEAVQVVWCSIEQRWTA